MDSTHYPSFGGLPGAPPWLGVGADNSFFPDAQGNEGIAGMEGGDRQARRNRVLPHLDSIKYVGSLQ